MCIPGKELTSTSHLLILILVLRINTCPIEKCWELSFFSLEKTPAKAFKHLPVPKGSQQKSWGKTLYWKRVGLDWILGRNSLQLGWWDTGTGCPEKLWILILGIGWRSEQPALVEGVTVHGSGVGLDNPWWSLTNQTTLLFYNFSDLGKKNQNIKIIFRQRSSS